MRAFRRRLDELHGFLTTMGALFELVLRFGSDGVRQFAALLTESAGATAGPALERREDAALAGVVRTDRPRQRRTGTTRRRRV